MKQFWRTIPGKTLLFLGVLFSFALFAGSVAAALVMIETGVYERSEQSMIEQYASDNFYFNLYDFEQEDKETGSPPASIDMNYWIRGASGELLSNSIKNEISGEDGLFDYYSYLVREENGMFTDYGTFRAPDEIEEVITGGKSVYLFQMNLQNVQEIQIEGDENRIIAGLIHIAYRLRYAIYGIAVLAGLLTVLCFITLMCVSGRRAGTEELVPGPLCGIPVDLILAGVIILFIMSLYLLAGIGWYGDVITAVAIAVCGVILFCTVLGVAMSISCRIKQRSLFTNTVIWRICRLCRKVLGLIWRWIKALCCGVFYLCRGIPMIWKTCLVVTGIVLLELFVMLCCWWEMDNYMLFWLLEKLLLVPAILYGALMLRRLQKAGCALAEGDLNYQVNTKYMYWDMKQHGEHLNSIAGGMTRAVNERMKSERMKTELITNVSHDIKTPLTSIINYADLIGKENCENSTVTEYAAVLVRQSVRLKRLIEDLVEASKASSGNLDVELVPCDAEIFLTQIAGEYEQRLADAGLALVTRLPENPVNVMADGRRMQRVFDNLMNNICKYAQTGTRVYLTLEKTGRQAVITFRNTSREELNIEPDELMERFVRGDLARSTEGNGLGLSIARSLTELQNGSFELSIDGDLFKVILKFPVVE